jgi:parallel beta-helix repeat protein
MPHRKKVSRLGLAGAVILAIVFLLAFSAPALAFPDVPAGHAYETAVNNLSTLGVIGGYANGNFGLNDAVKRMQFAKMIVGTLGITPNASTATRFTDLGAPDANGYPHKYVQAAYDSGITNGTNAAQTLFSPGNPIRRDQVISMIVRGAVNIFPGSLYSPPAGTLSLFDGAPEPHGENLRIAEYNHLLDGLIGMGPGWSVTATATRGEVAQMLWNLIVCLNIGGPPPPPPPSGDIWVYVDGTGDYPTIAAAIAAVPSGTTIYLGPGVFQLSSGLLVSKSLSLVGSGMAAVGGTTVQYSGDVIDITAGNVLITDIRFISTASAYASDAMYVNGGTVDLRRCYFSGGNYVAQWGRGLCVDESATVGATDCVFTLNDTGGIEVYGQAYLSTYGCVMSDNAENGVGLYETAVALIDQSDCMSNDLHGVSVNDNAIVTVQNSRCSQNGYTGDWASGIFLEENATGTVYNCECNSNLIDGISLHDDAQVTADYVTCNYNGEDGITLSEYSSGAIRHCTCSYSLTYDGIDVHDNSYAVLEYNLCAYNEQAGIWFGDYATGTANGNEGLGNYWGLYVDLTSYPTITASNYFHDNVVNLLFE